jgi:hypothetical protein
LSGAPAQPRAPPILRVLSLWELHHVEHPSPILLFAALALAVLGALRRVRMWRRGRPSKVDLIGGLLAMPKRYMVDLHHVVARDKYMSNTHVATAGGFVLSAVLAILVHGFGLHSRILGYALLAGHGADVRRCDLRYLRRLNPPSRLSKGPWMRLPKSLLAFSASFFIATLPVAGILPEGFGGWLRRSSASACCGACRSCSSA